MITTGERKEIHVETSAFSFTLHYNPVIVYAQVCLLIGLVLLWVFSSDAVRRLLVLIAIIDVGSVIFSLFFGASVSVDAPAAGVEAQAPSSGVPPVEDSTAPSTVNVQKANPVQPDSSAPQNIDGEIRNKVGARAPFVAPPPQPAPQPSPQPLPPPAPSSQPAPPPQPAAPVAESSDNTMSEDEIADLFDF